MYYMLFTPAGMAIENPHIKRELLALNEENEILRSEYLYLLKKYRRNDAAVDISDLPEKAQKKFEALRLKCRRLEEKTQSLIEKSRS